MNKVYIRWISILIAIATMTTISFAVLHVKKLSAIQSAQNEGERAILLHTQLPAPSPTEAKVVMKAEDDHRLAVGQAEKSISGKISQSTQRKIYWDKQVAKIIADNDAEKKYPPDTDTAQDMLNEADLEENLETKSQQNVMKTYHISEIELLAICDIGLSKNWPLPKQ